MGPPGWEGEEGLEGWPGPPGLTGPPGKSGGAYAQVLAPASITPTGPGIERMLGLCAGVSLISPQSSGVFFVIANLRALGGPSSTATFTLRYGTGAGPAFDAAATGTIIGNTFGTLITSSAQGVALHGLVTGLPLGESFWIDIGLQPQFTAVAVEDITLTVFEYAGAGIGVFPGGIPGLDAEGEPGPPGPTGPAGPAGAAGGGTDMPLTRLTVVADTTVTAGYSAVVVRKLTVNSGIKLIIGNGSRLRIL
jgi:hypothetical protein